MMVDGVPEEKILTLALDEWGLEAQEGMTIEEMGEVVEQIGKCLQKFNKRNRNVNGSTEREFIEELADLKIMLDQLEIAYGTEFESIRREKLSRILTRVLKDRKEKTL